ncbi:MAG: D-glycero-alpha-D-manno-heptose-1,7-bisphosphate 7-phosphatase [Rickettsiales bacterium]
MKLILLDRDGVINLDDPVGVIRRDQFELIPGSVAAIARLTQAGFKVAVCTNQSAIGKGWLSEELLGEIHAGLCAEVEKAGGKIDAIYYAPDHPDVPSLRRKPAPGMLLEALAEFSAVAAETYFVGDMLRDMEAALAAGCKRLLVRTGKGAKLEAAGIPTHVQPVEVVADLSAAVEYILALTPPNG